jgi:hypothetical protein
MPFTDLGFPSRRVPDLDLPTNRSTVLTRHDFRQSSILPQETISSCHISESLLVGLAELEVAMSIT